MKVSGGGKNAEKAKPHVFPPLPFSAKLWNVSPHSLFPAGPTTHFPDTEKLQGAKSGGQPLHCRRAKAQEAEVSHPS